MTPEFEKKLEKEIEDQCYSMPPVTKVYFNYGARWAYQQGILDCLEKLRSDPLIDGRRLEQEADLWADWLESEMMGGEER